MKESIVKTMLIMVLGMFSTAALADCGSKGSAEQAASAEKVSESAAANAAASAAVR